jgi:hypothetical protein
MEPGQDCNLILLFTKLKHKRVKIKIITIMFKCFYINVNQKKKEAKIKIITVRLKCV